jgi:single-stranded-DNA-specific exonuclease
MPKIIKQRTVDETVLKELAHLPEVMQRILAARGIKSAKEVDYQLAHLLPWNDLLGIQDAVTCLAEALKNDLHIVVIADFDVDGATSCALAVRALKEFGVKRISYLVPNRFTMGYGLTPEIVVLAQQQKADILLTVDNGIASHEGVAAAKSTGLKVVITDHHLPADTLPNADAIVNPNQHGDIFSSKSLCGVGVVFYVLLALRHHLVQQNAFPNNSAPNMAQFLDLVALGTVADLVSLDYNNRILVSQGLQRIRKGQTKPGIKALLTVAAKSLSHLNAADLGFAIAPRLNAAGRLEDMSVGIECLLTEDAAYAQQIAEELNALNQQRKSIEREMHSEALTILNKAAFLKKKESAEEVPAGVCLYADNWHVGVIGILASRIKERVYRPVVCFANDNETILKGSARSIPGVHIRDVLDIISKQYPQLILKFGGHAMAAGLTIKQQDFPLFQQAFANCVNQFVDQDILSDTLCTDGELSEFTLNFADTINAAGPWGQHFPEPLFRGKFKVLQKDNLGDKHLRLSLQSSLNSVEAMAFFVSEDMLSKRLDEIDIVYKLSVNEYRNIRRVQLIIEHFVDSTVLSR